MALQIYSRFDVVFLPKGSETRMHATGVSADRIPSDERNVTYRAFHHLLSHVGEPAPALHITTHNGIPLERGLGGSGSAILGGLLAANAWLDEALAQEKLLAMAADLDGHPDNVCPSLLGGLRVACVDGDAIHTLPVPFPAGLRVVLVVPELRLETRAARTVLPTEVPMADAVFNLGRLAVLLAAFAALEYPSLSVGMQDRLHQPYRRALIPQLDAVFDAAAAAGAWGVALSGAGPSVAAFCTDRADVVGEAMKAAFAAGGVAADTHITGIDSRGATVTRLAPSDPAAARAPHP